MRELPAPGAWRGLLVVIPNWVGDVVLATPVLAALRESFAGSRICYLMRGYVSEVVRGGGWHDEEIHWPEQRAGGRRSSRIEENAPSRSGTASVPAQPKRWLGLVRAIREQRFDAALLLTNSFRSALTTWAAGVPRRVGFARDGRSLLLTDRLYNARANGRWTPTPVLESYLRLAEAAGCSATDRRLRLGVTAEQEEAGARLKRHYGLDLGVAYAVVNPGAAFGASKCWLPERFAEVCDRLEAERGLRAVIVGAPGEAALMRSIAERSRSAISCHDPPTTLGSLKPLIRDARVLVCNDTGPRHYGKAFGVPTVTIFGPTDQRWTDTDDVGEIKLQVSVECGPCQLKTCPIDHRCMTRLTTEGVMDAIGRVLDEVVATKRCGTALCVKAS